MDLEGLLGRADCKDIRKFVSVTAATVLLASCALPSNPFVPASLHPRLEASNAGRLAVTSPVAIAFDLPVDLSRADVRVVPAVAIHTLRQPQRLLLTPADRWAPGITYTLSLAPFEDRVHNVALKAWQATFRTQPPLTVAGFRVDGQDVGAPAIARPGSTLDIRFPRAILPASVQITANGQPVAPASLAWAGDNRSVSLSASAFAPGASMEIGVETASSVEGDLLTEPGHLQLEVLIVEPSNGPSGVSAGFITRAPVEVVVENSGPARPQVGLQAADLVVEYISEYSISRMTALYFNAVPPLIGPVRSCRMINIPLTFAFHGLTMCSGASDGTLGQLWHQGVPVVINDYDHGGHFFRSSARPAPHNLYTSGDRAERLRQEMSVAPGPYVVDPAHADALEGQAAAPPAVPLHAVAYAYDPGRQLYLRTDHGSPFIDGATRAQLAIKTIAIVHAPYRDAGWVEDINGGAHSIIYDLNGQGPAELYSDGRVVNGIWHMAERAPIYFTDAAGRVLRLNSGLTWIHVIGNGQTH